MGVNSLLKTVTRQRHDCDLNPGPSAPQSSTITTRLLSHPVLLPTQEIPENLSCSISANFPNSQPICIGPKYTSSIVPVNGDVAVNGD